MLIPAFIFSALQILGFHESPLECNIPVRKQLAWISSWAAWTVQGRDALYNLFCWKTVIILLIFELWDSGSTVYNFKEREKRGPLFPLHLLMMALLSMGVLKRVQVPMLRTRGSDWKSQSVLRITVMGSFNSYTMQLEFLSYPLKNGAHFHQSLGSQHHCLV